MKEVSHTGPAALKGADAAPTRPAEALTAAAATAADPEQQDTVPVAESPPAEARKPALPAPEPAPPPAPAPRRPRPRHPVLRLPVLDLGICPYLPLQRLQGLLRQAVVDGTIAGVILLLEHDPVITLGSRGAMHDLRDPASVFGRGVEVVASERGGQTTLHAPGQLVSYPIVPIPGKDLSAYVRGLEEVILTVLAGVGVAGHRRPGHPGVYVEGDKIASVGLRCQRWVASHGTSLNVSLDLSLFDLIVSCGEPAMKQTSVARLTGANPGMDKLKRLYCQAAARVFSWELRPMEGVPHWEVETALGLRVSPAAAPPRHCAMPTAGFEPATPGSGGQCSIP